MGIAMNKNKAAQMDREGQVAREGLFAKVTFGYSPECSESVSHVEICGESAPGRGISKCRGSERGFLPGICGIAKKQEQNDCEERSRRGADPVVPSGPLWGLWLLLWVKWEPVQGCEQRRDMNGLGFNRIPLTVVQEINCGAEAGRPVRRLLLLCR